MMTCLLPADSALHSRASLHAVLPEACMVQSANYLDFTMYAHKSVFHILDAGSLIMYMVAMPLLG